MSTPERRAAIRSSWPARLAYLAGVLALLELTARLFFAITGKDIEVYRNFTTTRLPRMMITDPVLGWRMQPNVTRNALTSDFSITYHINSLGMRDAEPGGREGYDLLFIGDSQTFGEGVPLGARFSDRVREGLPGVSTLNAAVPGYSLHQMVRLFQLDGWRLRPELVVCAVIEIDLWRTIGARYSTKGPPQVIENPDEYAWLSPWLRKPARRLERFLRSSYLFAVFSTRAKLAWLSHRLAERDRAAWSEIEGATPTAGMPDRPDQPSLTPEEALVRETSLGLFGELQASARRAGAELLVVNIDDHSVGWLDSGLRARGIAYADLAAALRGVPGTRYTIDPHYNARGHALLASALTPAIRARFDLERRNAGADEAALERQAAALSGNRAAASRPLAAFAVDWLATELPARFVRGVQAPVRVRVRNTTQNVWLSGTGGPERAVRLGYRWLGEDGTEGRDYPTARLDLLEDLPPGGEAAFSGAVAAPPEAGRRLLQFDLVQEGVAWFGARGATRNTVAVEVR